MQDFEIAAAEYDALTGLETWWVLLYGEEADHKLVEFPFSVWGVLSLAFGRHGWLLCIGPWTCMCYEERMAPVYRS